jgi:shikimate dehydrogenase
MHNAAYEALGFDWEYGLYACEDVAAFNATVAAAATDPEFIGFNVTMPYKRDAFAVSDELSAAARATGGVNVLTFERKGRSTTQPSATCATRIAGTSTDGAGIVRSLERDGDVDIAAARVLICGTGPTAAAALVALAEVPAASIAVLSRDVRRAQALIDAAGAPLAEAAGSVWAAGYDEAPGLLRDATVLVDATSLGMRLGDPAVLPVELLGLQHTVLDVVYGQGQTALLRGAMAAGARAFDGLGMLVEQAALTIELWAQAQGRAVQAPRAVMLQAARAALAERSTGTQQ